ncbi:hypothetical protein A9Q99_15025 [Gammaproteobacteria bacterium 45_16_T64]|nr:hypothetical protein A9Q99_15025 [Gammaproteobacteria bacterium 45_16_T64]
MRSLLLLLLFFVMTFSNVSYSGEASNSSKYQVAEELYKDGKKEEAKALYFEAAKEGDAGAHFSLGYKYNLQKDKQIYHLRKAAESGHLEGLKGFLDKVFFRSDSFEHSNPTLAMAVYRKAKLVNPSIKFYDEKNSMMTISLCLEPKGLDVKQFLDKYNADIADSPWRWAKNISVNESDPELVLSLICLGGHVPNEKKSAVKSYYKFWKSEKSVKFNGCDYAASNYTLAICSRDERY